MNMNYSDSYTTASHDYAESKREAFGLGTYTNKAYAVAIIPIAEDDGILLRSCGKKYEILFDGEVNNRFTSLSEAEAMFRDFTGLSKPRYAKVKDAMAAKVKAATEAEARKIAVEAAKKAVVLGRATQEQVDLLKSLAA